MLKRNSNGYNAPSRYMGLEELRQYTSLGKNGAVEIGRRSGAVIRFGRRVLYDREKIDAYMQTLLETEAC